MLETVRDLGIFGMTGVIWLVQLLVYPAFFHVGTDRWRTYHKAHTKRITPVVLPLMSMHLIASGLLCLKDQNTDTVAHLVIAGLTWGSTFFVFVPLHHALAPGPDKQLIKTLIQLNWIRTFLWTLSTILLVI